MSPPPYPQPSSAAVSAVMRGNRRSDTRPEVALRSALHRRGLRFRKDLPLRLDGRLTRPDIVFTRQRLAVYVDGCFWHRCPEHGTRPQTNTSYWGPKLQRNVDRDKAVTLALELAGWTVIRVWEHVPVLEATQLVVDELNEAARKDPAPPG